MFCLFLSGHFTQVLLYILNGMIKKEEYCEPLQLSNVISTKTSYLGLNMLYLYCMLNEATLALQGIFVLHEISLDTVFKQYEKGISLSLLTVKLWQILIQYEKIYGRNNKEKKLFWFEQPAI